MTIDTTFSPLTSTYQIGAAAVQVAPKDLSGAVSTYRVRCLASGYLTWGQTSGVAAAGAPGASPVANTVGLTTGGVGYLQLPPGVYFISSVAAGFEVTGGQGGVGG
jgi:hypothetical protein